MDDRERSSVDVTYRTTTNTPSIRPTPTTWTNIRRMGLPDMGNVQVRYRKHYNCAFPWKVFQRMEQYRAVLVERIHHGMEASAYERRGPATWKELTYCLEVLNFGYHAAVKKSGTTVVQ